MKRHRRLVVMADTSFVEGERGGVGGPPSER